MNKLTLILAIILGLGGNLYAQEQEIQKDLKPFERVIASPRINVILKKGDHESIRLVYNGVSKTKINIEVRRKTLHVYLDDARKIEKMATYDYGYRTRNGIYEGATITAHITYTSLEALEIRGKQELTCLDPITAEEFRLKAYGENDITLASLKTEFFKASLYGENTLKIKKGRVIEQKYKLYGENRIDTRELKSAFASASIFGEGNVKINTTEDVRLDAFGEPSIHVNGGGHVNKRLVIGRISIYED